MRDLVRRVAAGVVDQRRERAPHDLGIALGERQPARAP